MLGTKHGVEASIQPQPLIPLGRLQPTARAVHLKPSPQTRLPRPGFSSQIKGRPSLQPAKIEDVKRQTMKNVPAVTMSPSSLQLLKTCWQQWRLYIWQEKVEWRLYMRADIQRQRTVRCKAWRAWRHFIIVQKQKSDRKRQLEALYVKWVQQLYFQLWIDHLLEIRRVQKSQEHTVQVAMYFNTARRQQSSFKFWRLRWQRVQCMERVSAEMRLKQIWSDYFRQWNVHTQAVLLARQIYSRKLIVKMWDQLRRRLMEKELCQLNNAASHHNRTLSRQILLSWHHEAVRLKEQRRKEEMALYFNNFSLQRCALNTLQVYRKRRLNQKQLKDCADRFARQHLLSKAWSLGFIVRYQQRRIFSEEHTRCALAYYYGSLCNRFFCKWVDYWAEHRLYQGKTRRALVWYTRALQSRVLCAWIDFVHYGRCIRDRQGLYERQGSRRSRLLKSVLTTWTERSLQRQTYRLLFARLQNQHRRNDMRLLFHTWMRRYTQRLSIEYDREEQLFSALDVFVFNKLARSFFNCWRRSTRLVCIRRHLKQQRYQRSFNTWQLRHKKRSQAREHEKLAQAFDYLRILRGVFLRWYQQRPDWHQRYDEAQVVKFRSNHLIRRAFFHWSRWFRHGQLLEISHEGRNRKRGAKSFEKWRSLLSSRKQQYVLTTDSPFIITKSRPLPSSTPRAVSHRPTPRLPWFLVSPPTPTSMDECVQEMKAIERKLAVYAQQRHFSSIIVDEDEAKKEERRLKIRQLLERLDKLERMVQRFGCTT